MSHVASHTEQRNTGTRHTSHVTTHTSHLTPHTSHLTPHTSHLTPHTSLVIPPTTFTHTKTVTLSRFIPYGATVTRLIYNSIDVVLGHDDASWCCTCTASNNIEMQPATHKPQTSNPKPQTPNPKPQTLNPKPPLQVLLTRAAPLLWGGDRQGCKQD